MATARVLLRSRTGPAGHLGRVVAAGRIEGGRGVPGPGLRRYDRYAVMLLVHGTGRYVDASGEVPLVPGSLVHVYPGHPHWYGPVSGTWHEVYLVVEGPAFDTCLQTGLLDPRRPVRRLQPVAAWRDRLERIGSRAGPSTPAEADQDVCDVLRLLVDAAGGDASRPAPSRSGWLARSQALLAGDLGEPLDVRDVAAAVGLGYESWRKRFTAEAGQPPARYRAQARVQAACDLLRWTSLSNREVAATLDFSDEHHFARAFRRGVGLTTTAFRNAGR